MQAKFLSRDDRSGEVSRFDSATHHKPKSVTYLRKSAVRNSRGNLKLNDSSTNADRDGLSPIICVQFLHDVLEKLTDDAKRTGFPLVRLGDKILEHAGKGGIHWSLFPEGRKVPGKAREVCVFVATAEGSNTCGIF
jgi:hypothetical protein